MVVCTLILLFLGWFLWSIVQAAKIAVIQLRRMHQVPCDRCAYFTHSYHLKCTVRPCQALTESAIGCMDFAPVTRSCRPSFWQQYCQPLAKAIRSYFVI
jgi:hypothetical protein